MVGVAVKVFVGVLVKVLVIVGVKVMVGDDVGVGVVTLQIVTKAEDRVI